MPPLGTTISHRLTSGAMSSPSIHVPYYDFNKTGPNSRLGLQHSTEEGHTGDTPNGVGSITAEALSRRHAVTSGQWWCLRRVPCQIGSPDNVKELCEGVNIKYTTAGREHIISKVIKVLHLVVVCTPEGLEMPSCRPS
jgi:hypothetical protein